MRQYHEGDDLRRIHWPSVARTGELMIRQDESSQRANGLVFLDSREGTLDRRTARRSSERFRSLRRWRPARARRLLPRLATADIPPASYRKIVSSRRSPVSVTPGPLDRTDACPPPRGRLGDTTLVLVAAPAAR